MAANAPAGGVGQEVQQHLDLLQLREQQPNPVALSDVTEQCVELNQLLVQHQGLLDAVLAGQAPAAPPEDTLVSLACILSRRHQVLRDAAAALAAAGTDVSTLTPLLDTLPASLQTASASLMAVVAAAGQQAAAAEQAAGAVDSEGQMQEVQRLAEMCQLLTGSQAGSQVVH